MGRPPKPRFIWVRARPTDTHRKQGDREKMLLSEAQPLIDAKAFDEVDEPYGQAYIDRGEAVPPRPERIPQAPREALLLVIQALHEMHKPGESRYTGAAEIRERLRRMHKIDLTDDKISRILREAKQAVDLAKLKT